MQAVDEKLFAMGGASVPQPLDDLYERVDSGIVRLTATHQVPTMAGPEGEGGNTTGGGPRSDFRDTLLFRQLTTDATGRASVTVRLSDDLTSWHVTASAVTVDLAAGAGELLVPVGLPFFVEATIADTYLVSDRPIIRLRAYGDALRAGDPVEFTVRSASLGLARDHRGRQRLRGRRASSCRPSRRAASRSTWRARRRPAGTRTAMLLSDRAAPDLRRSCASRLTAASTASGSVADGLPTVAPGAGQSPRTPSPMPVAAGSCRSS